MSTDHSTRDRSEGSPSLWILIGQVLGIFSVGAVVGFAFNPEGLRSSDRAEVRLEAPPIIAATLTPSELARLLAADPPCVVLDARKGADFIVGHIPGALALYGPDMEDRTREVRRWLSKEQTIVVVDANAFDVYARRRAAEFQSSGLSNVRALEGGMEAWKAQGGDVVTGWDMDAVLRESNR